MLPALSLGRAGWARFAWALIRIRGGSPNCSVATRPRGDIGTTAKGYAAAYLSHDAPFHSDAVTVNPYMGMDTLEPFLEQAEANGKGVVVLARTSNPGSADFQAKDLEGAPLYARVVEALAPAIERLKSPDGWSSLMLVAGATGPDDARKLVRERLTRIARRSGLLLYVNGYWSR